MPKAKAKSNRSGESKGPSSGASPAEATESGPKCQDLKCKNEVQPEKSKASKVGQEEQEGKGLLSEPSTSTSTRSYQLTPAMLEYMERMKNRPPVVPYTGPRIDPVVFFTQVHSMPHIIDEILDNAKHTYEYMHQNWADEKRMEIKLARQMGLVRERRPWLKDHAKKLKQLGNDKVKLCVRTMLMLLRATIRYKAPATFSVSSAWRSFMLDRASRGKEPNYAYRTKLEFHRECVLALTDAPPPCEMSSDECPACASIFLLMTETDLTDEGLYFWMCRTTEFSQGLDICGRHHDLYYDIEDCGRYAYVSPPGTDEEISDSDSEKSEYRSLFDFGFSDDDDDDDDDDDSIDQCNCQ